MKIFFRKPIQCFICNNTDFIRFNGYGIRCTQCSSNYLLDEDTFYEFENEMEET